MISPHHPSMGGWYSLFLWLSLAFVGVVMAYWSAKEWSSYGG